MAHLDAKTASIDVVAEEEIRVLWHIAADFKELHQIVLCTRYINDGEPGGELGRTGRTYWPWISPHTGKKKKTKKGIRQSSPPIDPWRRRGGTHS